MDRSTIDNIFRENAGEFARHAERWLADPDEARDVVQDAFVKLWQQPEVPAKPKGSLFVAVRNLCLDRLRRRSVRKTLSLSEAFPDHGDLKDFKDFNDLKDLSDLKDHTDQADQQERYQAVERIINRHLTPRDREILLLHDYSGWDYDEIAERTGLAPAALRMIVSRGRKTVREEFLKQQRR